ncbi:hypothetical protein EZS27_002728 [termite gut metagenome]|uniref:Uncharacterized protein n=1 Tax=termite gut metagenome TaxID=433724 RepID=A0A5J4SVL3_9ZZZZ
MQKSIYELSPLMGVFDYAQPLSLMSHAKKYR